MNKKERIMWMKIKFDDRDELSKDYLKQKTNKHHAGCDFYAFSENWFEDISSSQLYIVTYLLSGWTLPGAPLYYSDKSS